MLLRARAHGRGGGGCARQPRTLGGACATSATTPLARHGQTTRLRCGRRAGSRGIRAARRRTRDWVLLSTEGRRLVDDVISDAARDKQVADLEWSRRALRPGRTVSFVTTGGQGAKLHKGQRACGRRAHQCCSQPLLTSARAHTVRALGSSKFSTCGGTGRKGVLCPRACGAAACAACQHHFVPPQTEMWSKATAAGRHVGPAHPLPACCAVPCPGGVRSTRTSARCGSKCSLPLRQAAVARTLLTI